MLDFLIKKNKVSLNYFVLLSINFGDISSSFYDTIYIIYREAFDVESTEFTTPAIMKAVESVIQIYKFAYCISPDDKFDPGVSDVDFSNIVKAFNTPGSYELGDVFVRIYNAILAKDVALIPSAIDSDLVSIFISNITSRMLTGDVYAQDYLIKENLRLLSSIKDGELSKSVVVDNEVSGTVSLGHMIAPLFELTGSFDFWHYVTEIIEEGNCQDDDVLYPIGELQKVSQAGGFSSSPELREYLKKSFITRNIPGINSRILVVEFFWLLSVAHDLLDSGADIHLEKLIMYEKEGLDCIKMHLLSIKLKFMFPATTEQELDLLNSLSSEEINILFLNYSNIRSVKVAVLGIFNLRIFKEQTRNGINFRGKVYKYIEKEALGGKLTVLQDFQKLVVHCNQVNSTLTGFHALNLIRIFESNSDVLIQLYEIAGICVFEFFISKTGISLKPMRRYLSIANKISDKHLSLIKKFYRNMVHADVLPIQGGNNINIDKLIVIFEFIYILAFRTRPYQFISDVDLENILASLISGEVALVGKVFEDFFHSWLDEKIIVLPPRISCDIIWKLINIVVRQDLISHHVSKKYYIIKSVSFLFDNVEYPEIQEVTKLKDTVHKDLLEGGIDPGSLLQFNEVYSMYLGAGSPLCNVPTQEALKELGSCVEKFAESNCFGKIGRLIVQLKKNLLVEDWLLIIHLA